jgi:hypothetical protein
MVAVEGATDLPGDDGRPGETERSKPALSRAGAEPQSTGARDS